MSVRREKVLVWAGIFYLFGPGLCIFYLREMALSCISDDLRGLKESSRREFSKRVLKDSFQREFSKDVLKESSQREVSERFPQRVLKRILKVSSRREF